MFIQTRFSHGVSNSLSMLIVNMVLQASLSFCLISYRDFFFEKFILGIQHYCWSMLLFQDVHLLPGQFSISWLPYKLLRVLTLLNPANVNLSTFSYGGCLILLSGILFLYYLNKISFCLQWLYNSVHLRIIVSLMIENWERCGFSVHLAFK